MKWELWGGSACTCSQSLPPPPCFQQSICTTCHRWPPPVIPETPRGSTTRPHVREQEPPPPPSSSFTFRAAVPRHAVTVTRAPYFPSPARAAVKRLDRGGKIAFILLPLDKYSGFFLDPSAQHSQLVNNGCSRNVHSGAGLKPASFLKLLCTFGGLSGGSGCSLGLRRGPT